MNAEFHYHITWLIAARAGLPAEDTEILATSSQYTDDNSIIFEIDKDMPTAYGNYISQTMNILKPKAKLLRIYPIFHDSGMTEKELQKSETTLKKDLDNCIGEQDQANEYARERITRYNDLAIKPEYGRTEITQYDEDTWLEQAVNEKVRGLRDRSDLFLTRWDPLTDIYTWKDRENYRDTHWHRFQQAVKQHQDETWAILKETNLKGLQLPEM
jgi:hypothetical protein